MDKENWIWMPHAGHLCVANSCRFHLNTYVNGYIISTVGEYLPSYEYLKHKLKLKIKNFFGTISDEEEEKINKLLELSGSALEATYLDCFGYEEVGAGSTYETIVFKAKKNDNPKYQCCPYVAIYEEGELDIEGYNDPTEASKGHYKMCERWGKNG